MLRLNWARGAGGGFGAVADEPRGAMTGYRKWARSLSGWWRVRFEAGEYDQDYMRPGDQAVRAGDAAWGISPLTTPLGWRTMMNALRWGEIAA